MRLLITQLLIVCHLMSFSQEISRDENDEFTGTRVVETKAWVGNSFKRTDFIDTKSNVLLNMAYSKTKDKEGFYFIELNIISTVNFGCLSEYEGKIIFLFENDSTMTLKQVSKTDCNSNTVSASYVPLNKEQIKNALWSDIMNENIAKLGELRLKKIRVYGTEGYYDFELKEEKTDVVIQHLHSIQSRL